MSDSESIKCTDCGILLPNSHIREDQHEPCPGCGSIRKIVSLNFSEEAGIEVHDWMKAKAKDPSRPSKDKVRQEVFSGDDLRHKDGKWMQKERIIDKDNDHYRETVVDPETGEVVHHTSEKLSEHRGHGSAKHRK